MENLPTRNQNPGDLRDPSSGSFRQFDSPQQGYAALLNDLTAKMTGTSSTGIGPSSSLADFAKVYAPPTENNTAQYTANLANKLHISPDTKIGTLKGRIGDFANAIAGNEGYAGAGHSTTPQTQIPTAQAATAQPQPQSLGQQAMGAAAGVGNFFFPIVQDVANDLTGQNTGASHKSFGQQAGDLGLSALPFVPGLGEAGVAAKGVGLIAKGAKLAKTVGAGAGIGYGADVAQHLSSGETDAGKILTPGLGTVTGGALSSIGAGLAATGDNTSARLINSIIKPLKKDFAYGTNPGRGVAAEGIVGNSFDDLAKKIEGRRAQIGQAIGDIADSVSPGGKKLLRAPAINLSKTLSPIDDALDTAAEQNNTQVFERLKKVKQALTDVMKAGVDEDGVPQIISTGARKLARNTYKEAQGFKQLIGDMTQWTGNISDDKAVNAALQDVWRGISSAQKDALEGIPNVGPEIKAKLEQLNERYGDLTSAGIATKYREIIHGRQNIVSLGDKMFGGVGGIAGLLAGGIPGGAAAGIGMGIASHVLGSIPVKTRMARFLAGAAGKQSAVKASSRVKGLVPRLLKTGVLRGAAGTGQ